MLEAEKFIPGCFNLHELPGEYCEAAPYQIPERSGAGRDSPEPIPPVSAVRTGQGRDVVFVKVGLSAEYRTEGFPVFTAPCDRNMDREGDLRVRDDGRKKDCMSTSAVPAADPCDTQGKDAVLKDDFPGITAMPDEASGVAAGTGDECQVKGKHRFIIKILGNKVVVFCFNCYHKE